MIEIDTATKLPRSAYLIVKHFQRAEGGTEKTIERIELDTEAKRKDIEKATVIVDLATNTVVVSRYPMIGPEVLLYTYRNKYAEQIVEFLHDLGIPDPLAADANPTNTETE